MLDYKTFRAALLNAAGEDTAYNPEAYRTERTSDLDEHCGAVAHATKAYYGGTILMGNVKGERHFWNRLPDGSIVDFSSCQYGGDGFTPVSDKGRPLPERRTVNARFLVFEARVQQALNLSP